MSNVVEEREDRADRPSSGSATDQRIGRSVDDATRTEPPPALFGSQSAVSTERGK